MEVHSINRIIQNHQDEALLLLWSNVKGNRRCTLPAGMIHVIL